MAMADLSHREADRLRRFDIMIDLTAAAKHQGFRRVASDTWEWSRHAGLDILEDLRKERWRKLGWAEPKLEV